MDRAIAREIAKYGIQAGDKVTIGGGSMYAGQHGTVARVAKGAGVIAAIVRLDSGMLTGSGLWNLIKAPDETIEQVMIERHAEAHELLARIASLVDSYDPQTRNWGDAGDLRTDRRVPARGGDAMNTKSTEAIRVPHRLYNHPHDDLTVDCVYGITQEEDLRLRCWRADGAATLDMHEVRRLADSLTGWLERVVGARLRARLAELVEQDARLDHASTSAEGRWGLRNALVCNVVSLARPYGLVAGYGRDDSMPGYALVAYVDLPTGQVSWHLPTPYVWGAYQPQYAGEWDGHSRAQKAERIRQWIESEVSR